MLKLMSLIKQSLKLTTLSICVFLLAACGAATPTPVPTPTSQYLDTPTLINQAFDRGEITEEERLLYLAYALYEHESLPARFQSSFEWFGEVAAEELDEVVSSPAKLCSMSPHVRSELLRVIKKTEDDTVCN